MTLPKLPSGEYDLIASLGKKCQPAGRIKRFGFRDFSGPFDWFANQTLPQVHKILVSGTDHMFLPGNLTLEGSHKEYAVIVDSATGIRSMHDIKQDEADRDLPAAIASMMDKISRRRAALLSALEKSRRALLVRLNAEVPHAAKLRTSLATKFPNVEIEILVIKEKAGGPITVHDTEEHGIYLMSGDNAPSGEEWLGSDELWEVALRGVKKRGTNQSTGMMATIEPIS